MMSGCWFRGRCRRLKVVAVTLAVIVAITHTMTMTPNDQPPPPPRAGASVTALASASAASASARNRDDDHDDAAVDRRAADDGPYIADPASIGDLDQFGALGAVRGQVRDAQRAQHITMHRAAHYDHERPRGSVSRADEHKHNHENDLSRRVNASVLPTGHLANAASSNVGTASTSSIDGGAASMRTEAPAPLAKSSVAPRQFDLLQQPCGSRGVAVMTHCVCRHGQCVGSACTQGSSRNSAGVAVSGWVLSACADCRCAMFAGNANHDSHGPGHVSHRERQSGGTAANFNPAPPRKPFAPNASSEHPMLFFSPRDVEALRQKAKAHPKLAGKLVQLAAFVKQRRRRGIVAALNSTLFRSRWNTQYGDLLPPFAFYCVLHADDTEARELAVEMMSALAAQPSWCKFRLPRL